MTDLLDFALEAHGGLDRWRQLTRVQAVASIGGVMWAGKGHAGVLAHTTATVDTRTERTTYEPFGAHGHLSVFTPDHVEILDADGAVLAARDNPRGAFGGHTSATPWDELHAAYFAGYAMWNYLSVPFLLTWDGIGLTELDPWQENGETWRRLRAEFPTSIATHNTVQTYFFGADDGLLRRHDYNADVFGGSPSSHYTADHRQFDGFSFPTRRWVVPRNPDDTTLDGPIMVSIDLQSVSVS